MSNQTSGGTPSTLNRRSERGTLLLGLDIHVPAATPTCQLFFIYTTQCFHSRRSLLTNEGIAACLPRVGYHGIASTLLIRNLHNAWYCFLSTSQLQNMCATPRNQHPSHPLDNRVRVLRTRRLSRHAASLSPPTNAPPVSPPSPSFSSPDHPSRCAPRRDRSSSSTSTL